MTHFRHSHSSFQQWLSILADCRCYFAAVLVLAQGCAPEITTLGWEHTRGPAAQNVSALIISATDARQLTAGLTTGELFRSTDGGDTWASLALIKPIAPIHRLIQHPEDLSRLYAATGSGLKESLDGGRSWENVLLPVAGGLPDVQTMALDPYSPSILFAGVHTAGLLRSNNDGKSWAPVRQLALAASDSVVDVRDIAIDPVNPSAMYVAVMGKGIFKTTNRGDSWTYVTRKLGIHGTKASALCVASTGRTVLYGTANGNIFRSTDEGETWNPVRQGYLDRQITSISSVPEEKTFYAGTDLGILASTDGREH